MQRRISGRQLLLTSAGALLLLGGLLLPGPAIASGRGGCGGCGRGAGGCGHGQGMQMRGGPGGGHHENIHGLLDRHEAIERSVKEIEGGVETVTTSEDPEVTRMIREHVRDMKRRVESGHGMRWWDPVFAELFRHHDEIEMRVEEIPGGVRVRETSESPDVVLLIRQHALRGVSEFVAGGHARAHRPTPLPEGYPTPAD